MSKNYSLGGIYGDFFDKNSKKGPKTDNGKPAGNGPEGKKPERNKPAGNRPEGNRPAGNRPTGNKPTGNKPEGNNSGKQKPEQKTSGNQKADIKKTDSDRSGGNREAKQDHKRNSEIRKQRPKDVADIIQEVEDELKSLEEYNKLAAKKQEAEIEKLAGMKASRDIAALADSSKAVKVEEEETEEIEELPKEDPAEVKAEIEKLIGLTNIKSDIEALVDFIKVQKLREDNGLPSSGLSLHTAFIGNPGTGKTTIARLMGRYFRAIGILEKGHIVEVSRADLVAEHVGGTAVKTNKVIDSAKGGILFIDEAYSLSEGGDNDFGKEAINIIVDRMEKDRDEMAIFFAGYDEDMEDFFSANAGLASRVTRKFYFEDYDGPELLEIFNLISNKKQYKLSETAQKSMLDYLNYIYYVRDNNFGNGRDVRNAFELLIKNQADRIASLENIDVETLTCLTDEDVENALKVSTMVVDHDNLDHVLKELDQYVGLEEIKEHISSLINLIKTNNKRKELGLPVKSMTYHTIFTGAPGTGKTTIARILGKIYQTLGILKKGHLVEVDRSGLVGGYVGQTEEKTSQVIDSAIDGILFVDEAYALAGGGSDFGEKAIDTILKRMDDDRERLVVIVAGYTDEMHTFVKANPGLKDRFTREFEFKDFSFEQLTEIFDILAKKQHFIVDESAKARLMEYFENILITNPINFGNGRFVRNLFERTVMEQATRLSSEEDLTKELLTTIKEEDINQAIRKI